MLYQQYCINICQKARQRLGECSTLCYKAPPVCFSSSLSVSADCFCLSVTFFLLFYFLPQGTETLQHLQIHKVQIHKLFSS